MKLAKEAFAAIKAGRKTIECRLFDEKRQKVAVGDEIIFTESENEKDTIRTEVTALYQYPSFAELFAKHDTVLFGGERDRQLLLKHIEKFYSASDEETYGVLGIRLKLMD